MSSVRTRAVSRPVPMSGQRIPPPPSFAPPSLPNTDNLLTTYSRIKSASSSRSVSPVITFSTDQESDSVKSIDNFEKSNEIKSENIEEGYNATVDNHDKKENHIIRQIQAPEMKIEPPTPPTEKKIEFTQINVRSDTKVEKQIISSDTDKSNPRKDIVNRSDKVLEKTPSKDRAAVQTKEFSQSQHNFDVPDPEAEKSQENVRMGEVEKESLYEKFPLQEEKHVKHKLKRRVSKKGSSRKIQNTDELNKDIDKPKEEKVKTFDDNQSLTNIILREDIKNATPTETIGENAEEQLLEKETKNPKARSRSSSRIRGSLLSKESEETPHPDITANKNMVTKYQKANANVDIPEIKIDGQDALEGLNVTESGATVEFTSGEEKFRMESSKHKERVDKEESDLLAKNENVNSDGSVIDTDDIVHEILGSCNDVNKILNRIMDNKGELENEESEFEENNEIPAADMDSYTHMDTGNDLKDESIKDKSISGNVQEPLDLVENIADLTVEKVKEYLQMEEKVNESLREELESTKEKKINLGNLKKDETLNKLFKDKIQKNKGQEAKFVSQLNNGKSLDSKKIKILEEVQAPKPNKISEIQAKGSLKQKEKPQVAEKNKPNYASKKEQQIAKIKDFLKDPNSTKSDEIKLDVRLRQSDTEKEESSKEVTKILDGLYLASYTALKESDASKDGITSVIEISSNNKPLAKTDVLHIRLYEDNAALEDTFEQIADKVENSRKGGGKVLIACEQSTGLAAVLCIPYFIKYEGMSAREAAKILEEKRHLAKLHTGTLLRIEEWERKLQAGKLSGGLSSFVASWLPMVFVILLGYLVLKMVFERVDREHMEEKRSTSDMYMKLYEYFDVRKWP